MNWYKNLSFSKKLIYPSLLLILVVGFSSYLGFSNVNALEERAKVIALEYLPSQNLLLQADRDLYQAQVAERSMIFVSVGSDSFKKLEGMHDENIQQAYDRVNQFNAKTTDDVAKQQVKKFNELFAIWKNTTEQVQHERANNGRAGRTTAIDLSFGQGAEQFDQMRTIIDQLTELVEASSSQAINDVNQTAETAHRSQIISTVIGTLVCLFFIFILPKMIATPLSLLVARVKEIASGDGDLTNRVEIDSKDELGEFAKAFNMFLDNLHEIISQVVSSTDRITSSSNELSAVSIDAKSSLEQQQMATDMVATAVNEMAATVQEVAQNATLASDGAKEADSNSVEGQRIIQETIVAINELASDIHNAESSISQLAQDSQNIGSVLDVIQSIAEQTNLLALNAAIEAARAGEQGRGFAVVADEVRSLAAKTQQSTEEIQKMINALQKGSQDAVNAISIGSTKANKSVEVVAQAEAALLNITEAVTQISDMNIQIATAVEEQQATTDEINVNVQNIASESASSLENSEKIARSSDELSTLAEGLHKLVGNFKL